ncbi:hypothetical protein Pla110_25840 [Polystyrenella longa]|uniref:DUF3467 domain-containing protein n=1 Tax=Polystyrenella longa TaxID=2528007 RepID=A0A518CNR0_9PLAN|nr:DUF3467 domain-containing protein [Polystyrenella longa]QDU80848.1 hypothetical protein Pla110_25840 [Polystyrenella longa]
MSTADDTPQPEAAATPEGEARQAPTITVDDSEVNAGYANFCRVSSTPEEMILDLGLNPNPYGAANTNIKVNQRIIMNHYTAKRLLGALGAAVQRHEGAFGVLETDVRKRVKEAGQK